NLKTPEQSRILRAPLAEGKEGWGLGWCRQRTVTPDRQRIHLLWKGYAHAVQPPEAFTRHELVTPDRHGDPVTSFTSTADSHYQAVLAIIRKAREEALASPRVDMPGAKVLAGQCRQFLPPAIAQKAPALETRVDANGVVHLAWERSVHTIGLLAELHRSDRENFTPDASTLLVRTPLFRYADREAPPGKQYYGLVMASGNKRSEPAYATVDVPAPLPPPSSVTVAPTSGMFRLQGKRPSLR
ncbi:MAG: hypothetical protein ACC645_18305, partial [Pirellulales bacterium]